MTASKVTVDSFAWRLKTLKTIRMAEYIKITHLLRARMRRKALKTVILLLSEAVNRDTNHNK